MTRLELAQGLITRAITARHPLNALDVFILLDAIQSHTTGIAIQEKTRTPASTVTRHLRGLITAGYFRVTETPHGRRGRGRAEYHLTDEGRAITAHLIK